jgi:hypothetical protein
MSLASLAAPKVSTTYLLQLDCAAQVAAIT